MRRRTPFKKYNLKRAQQSMKKKGKKINNVTQLRVRRGVCIGTGELFKEMDRRNEDNDEKDL